MQQINNLSARIAHNEIPIKAAIDRVISSGWLVLGPEVKHFEQSFATYLGVDYCVSVANGTDAIELALKAMGIQCGDRVATVANAGMYTTTALLAIGAEPYFMDIDIDTRGATLEEVKQAIDAGVKAVVVTHLFGLGIPEIASIAEYCTKKQVPLLEDCAQAHGAQVNGKHVGAFGDAASFSFYPTKNLGALGDGGAVVSNNLIIAEKVKLLRQYGWVEKYKVSMPGARNSRLDEMQAAILTEFLPQLDQANSRRREIARQYSQLIQHPNVLVPVVGGEDYVAHLYVIRSLQRDALRVHLQAKAIASDIHYPIPDYRQPLFAQRFVNISLKNTELLAQEILTLPCYPEMTETDVQRVVNAVNNWQL
jgi:dTDP-4-amino-4,6-dideoxygalactose transaminase